MSFINTFFFVFLVHSALSEDALVKPCSKNDITCLTNAAQSFLEGTSAGVPQLDIKPIDPMSLPDIEVTLDSGYKIYLTHVEIKNLKQLKIHDFKIDTAKKSVVLAMEDDPEITAMMLFGSKDSNNSSPLYVKPKVIPTATYTYDLVPNDKGVEYFTVGPETITCSIQGSSEFHVLEKFAKEYFKDNAAAESNKKKVICSIITPAFHTVIHNLRQSAKIYPKTSYFTDLD